MKSCINRYTLIYGYFCVIFFFSLSVYSEDLKTLDGTVYEDYTIADQDESGIIIDYKDGSTFISNSNLPEKIKSNVIKHDELFKYNKTVNNTKINYTKGNTAQPQPQETKQVPKDKQDSLHDDNPIVGKTEIGAAIYEGPGGKLYHYNIKGEKVYEKTGK